MEALRIFVQETCSKQSSVYYSLPVALSEWPRHMDIILRQKSLYYSIWSSFKIQDLHEAFIPRQPYCMIRIIAQVSQFYVLTGQVYLL